MVLGGVVLAHPGQDHPDQDHLRPPFLDIYTKNHYNEKNDC